MAGAPLGNHNAAKGKRFQLAVEKALRKRNPESKADEFEALVNIADQLLEKGLSGDIQAIKEIRDTLDGKPAQAVNLGDHEGKALTINLVHFGDKDGH